MYKHYIKIDERNYVIDSFASWQIEKFDDSEIFIKDSIERHYVLNLYNEFGKLKLKYIDESIIELTDEEIIADMPHVDWLNEYIRPRRDNYIDCSIWIFERQQVGESSSKMETPEYKLWLDYWQELRDLPATITRENEVWPICPDVSLLKGGNDG